MKTPLPCRSRVPRRFFEGAAALLLALALLTTGSRPVRAVEALASASHEAGTMPGYDIIRLGRGHYNRLCLAATIEGTKGLMILDTGASFTLLSSDRYKFLLSDPDRKLPPGVPATTSVNGLKSPVSVAHDFHVGNTNLGAVAVCLVGKRYLYDQGIRNVQNSERQYDGLLGENLLRRYRAVLDCGRLALYLNTDPARKVNLGPGLTQAGWTRVPMFNLGNDFVVPCEINGHRFRLIVDTGAPFINMNRGLLHQAGVSTVDIPMRGGLIGKQAEAVGFQKLDNVRIGDYTATKLQVLADPQSYASFGPKGQTSDVPILGLLGGIFLAANDAIIDVDGHALYLKPGGATPAKIQR